MVNYKKESKQVGVSVVGTIFSTSDYTIFKKLKGNRETRKNKDLKKEIMEMGQLQPVLVNSRYEVIDGQHRLEVLKELNKPVQFCISDSISPRTVISVNTTQKGWKDEDYLNFFAKQGHAEYLRLKQLYNQYRKYISMPIFLDMVDSSDGRRKFKTGEVTIRDEQVLLSKLSFFKEFVLETGYKPLPQTLQYSLLRFLSIPNASRTRLLKKFKSLGMVNEKHLFTNRERAFEQLIVNVYNHKLAPSSKGYIKYHYNQKKNVVIDLVY